MLIWLCIKYNYSQECVISVIFIHLKKFSCLSNNTQKDFRLTTNSILLEARFFLEVFVFLIHLKSSMGLMCGEFGDQRSISVLHWRNQFLVDTKVHGDSKSCQKSSLNKSWLWNHVLSLNIFIYLITSFFIEDA